MPSSLHPTTRWWYDLPDLAGEPPGPALSPALLAEEAEHGVTEDVAWAYAEAMPALLGPDPMVDLWPLAFRRGAMRAAALKQPVELGGLYHVQTSSPEVCRVMGTRVPSFSVRGEACVRALLRHGSAVREVVVSHCVPFAVDAPFRLVFYTGAPDELAPRWYESYIAEHFMPIARLDLSVWLCWDRDLSRPCVIQGHDTILEGRWGPRDVAPEAAPPPWAGPEAQTLDGDGWAATMLHNHRRAASSVVADHARGWCRLHTESDDPYHDTLRATWLAGTPLQQATGPGSHGTLASIRFDGELARLEWLGQERVLRLRSGQLEQLTTDHDLRSAVLRGDPGYPPELLEQLDDLPDVVVRGLPTDPPDEQTCRVEPGDRFILIDKGSQETLEREAGGHEALALRLHGDPPRHIARWMREVLVHTGDEQPVVIVDAGASVTTRPPRPRVQPAVTPSTRDLLERPAEFHGRHVRLRGVYRHAMEVANFADAWFTGEWKHGYGAWVVEAEGLWVHDGDEYGHLGYYKSELRGTLTMVDVSRARPISPDRIRFARRYVPLSAEVVLERRLRGWTHDGQWVTRLGGDARLPAPDLPERCRARVKFSVGMSGNLGIFTWQLLDAEPLTPERATVDAPGRRGRYIEIEGQLVPTHRYPRLDAVLDVCPPSLLHTFSIPRPEVVERIRSRLGAGRHVTIRGEMDESRLLAFSITDASGPLDL